MRKVLTFIAVVVCLNAAAASAAVRICRSGAVDVMADNTGAVPASAKFQQCIDDPLVSAINLEPGTYLFDATVVINRPFTIRTAGLATETRNCQQLGAARCARLLATSNPTACLNNSNYCAGRPTDFGGLVLAYDATRVVIDHLILDGNRANRQGTLSHTLCGQGYETYGANIMIVGCTATSSADRCEFTYNWTRNALCGSGAEFSGNYGRIQGNASYDNGTPGSSTTADGITVRYNNSGIVNDNHLVNNSNIALVVGGARNGQVQSNWIQQNGVYAKAALNLGFIHRLSGNIESGDFTNATIRYNTIQCYSFNCGFGLNLGHDPYKSTDVANVYGGTASQNNIDGARVLVNFGGAGVSTNRTTVTNNTLTNPPSVAMPVKPGSPCWADPFVLQNLANNNTTGVCGNFANADPLATSYNCLRACFPFE